MYIGFYFISFCNYLLYIFRIFILTLFSQSILIPIGSFWLISLIQIVSFLADLSTDTNINLVYYGSSVYVASTVQYDTYMFTVCV